MDEVQSHFSLLRGVQRGLSECHSSPSLVPTRSFVAQIETKTAKVWRNNQPLFPGTIPRP